MRLTVVVALLLGACVAAAPSADRELTPTDVSLLQFVASSFLAADHRQAYAAKEGWDKEEAAVLVQESEQDETLEKLMRQSTKLDREKIRSDAEKMMSSFLRSVEKQLKNVDKQQEGKTIETGLLETAATVKAEERRGIISSLANVFKKGKSIVDTITGKFAPNMAQAYEDCMGCRMVWKQVEMDVSNARYIEDVQASFEHNCMDAQKSQIFYKVCEDMYDDMYAMTDDYMSGKYTTDSMCQRAKMCIAL